MIGTVGEARQRLEEWFPATVRFRFRQRKTRTPGYVTLTKEYIMAKELTPEERAAMEKAHKDLQEAQLRKIDKTPKEK